MLEGEGWGRVEMVYDMPALCMLQVWAAARVLVSHVMTHQLRNKGGDMSIFSSLWPYLEVGGYEDELEQQVREVMSRGVGLTRAERTKGVARTLFCKDSQ